jgi:hypothetical protein
MFSSVLCEANFISDNPSLEKIEIDTLITDAVLKEKVNAESCTSKIYTLLLKSVRSNDLVIYCPQDDDYTRHLLTKPGTSSVFFGRRNIPIMDN